MHSKNGAYNSNRLPTGHRSRLSCFKQLQTLLALRETFQLRSFTLILATRAQKEQDTTAKLMNDKSLSCLSHQNMKTTKSGRKSESEHA